MTDKRSAKAGEQPPISAHPAFPAIVALWFAALLGLGSLVLPTALLESIAQLTGLAAIVEAAQPPLGVTARISIALAAALGGAILGLGIARKVVAANTPQPVTRRSSGPRPAAQDGPRFVTRPISAHEELGEGGLDADTAPPSRPTLPGRRRALAVTEDGARSDFLELAPLPGQSDAEPLDLVAFAEPEPVIDLEREPAPTLESGLEVESEAEVDIPFGSAGLSTPRRFDHHLEAPMPAPVAVHMPFARPVETQSDDNVAPEPAAASAPVEDRELGDLNVVELVERFALALQRRQAGITAAAVEEEPAPLVFPPASRFAAAPAVPDAKQTVPAALRPIDFAIEDDDTLDEEAEALPDFNLTATLGTVQRPFAAPFARLAVEEPEQDEDDLAEESYPSLLEMRSAFSQPRESVRIDDEPDADEPIEPVVVFPGQGMRQATPAADGPARDAMAPFAAPAGFRAFDNPTSAKPIVTSDAATPFSGARSANPADTERALREALEKLQRLSGAA